MPALEQYATRSAGGLATLASQWGRLDAEVVAMRARLDEGYGNLSLAGEESIDGRVTWRLDDRPEPGTTTSYWIDQGTHLPRRIAIDRPGRRDVRIDLAYGSGPRPSRAVAYLQGQRDVQLTLSPAFERTGQHNRSGTVTLGGLVGVYIAHIDDHLKFVYGKRANLGKPLPAAGA